MRSQRKTAFTLFELLVTLAVLSIVAGAGFFTISRSTGERSLERAAETVHSMVRIARTQAITNGKYARLIINADSSDPESYLRRIGVVIQDDVQDKWVAIDRGAYLPEGVFIVPQGSDKVTLSNTARRSVYKVANTDTVSSAVYRLEYPLKEAVLENAANQPDWICIQFAPNGRLSTTNWGGGGGVVPLSNQLIISKGSWVGDNVDLRNDESFIGIAFKKGGSSYQTSEADLVDNNDAET